MKMKSDNLAKLIVESYPNADLLALGTVKTLNGLADKAKDCGDSLFRHIVAEALEGSTDGHEVDTDRFEQLLTRSIEDIRAVIRALPDAKGFYR